MSTLFRCPGCRAPVTLAAADRELTCEQCGRVVADGDGIPDFVTATARDDERAHFDAEYEADHGGPPIDALAPLEQLWRDERDAATRIVWDQLQGLDGKRVLLLGNGGSVKELCLLAQAPELLICSDLSIVALRSLRRRLDLGAAADPLRLAAIDALDLPLADASVDVIYGWDFVHHLPEVDRFLQEVARVLRPGGRSVFRDSGYSPVWQWSKRTWLYPVMRFSHRRFPISPEDVRYTMAGGFRERDLAASARAAGVTAWFQRADLINYFWLRGTEKLLPRRALDATRSPAITDRLIAADRRLAQRPRLRGQMIDLVWGIQKPA